MNDFMNGLDDLVGPTNIEVFVSNAPSQLKELLLILDKAPVNLNIEHAKQPEYLIEAIQSILLSALSEQAKGNSNSSDIVMKTGFAWARRGVENKKPTDLLRAFFLLPSLQKLPNLDPDRSKRIGLFMEKFLIPALVKIGSGVIPGIE